MRFQDFEKLPHVMNGDTKNYIIPEPLLLRLIKSALLIARFDDEWYVNQYPDVRGAIEDGEIISAHAHYVYCGYFEGRDPCGFDEEFYLEKYEDVRNAVRSGVFESGFAHFQAVGRSEGRRGYEGPEPFDVEGHFDFPESNR